MAFSRKFSLKLKIDFKKLKETENIVKRKNFVVKYIRDESMENFLFATSISSYVGNAIVRNKIRRRVNEILFEYNKTNPIKHLKILFLARNQAKLLDYNNTKLEVCEIIENLMKFNSYEVH